MIDPPTTDIAALDLMGDTYIALLNAPASVILDLKATDALATAVFVRLTYLISHNVAYEVRGLLVEDFVPVSRALRRLVEDGHGYQRVVNPYFSGAELMAIHTLLDPIYAAEQNADQDTAAPEK
jgi:hypothetical protein